MPNMAVGFFSRRSCRRGGEPRERCRASASICPGSDPLLPSSPPFSTRPQPGTSGRSCQPPPRLPSLPRKFFISHDREFHVASLPYKADFKAMPEDWDGTTRDPDEVHYEISKREDEILYREFVQRMNFNKMKIFLLFALLLMAGEVKCHKYSRRRPSEGWNFTIEKLGPKDKRPGSSGGWRFVSLPDGSSRPLNDTEKMYVKREGDGPTSTKDPPVSYFEPSASPKASVL